MLRIEGTCTGKSRGQRVEDRLRLLGEAAQFAYEANDNLISQTDALGRVTSREYDELNRRTKRTLPGGTLFETFSYDAVGNMTARTDFNGNTTTFDYDVLNRLIRKTPIETP